MSDLNDEFMDRLIEMMNQPVDDPGGPRRPCLPIPCPPAEEITWPAIVIRCPECGIIPYGDRSIFGDDAANIVWTCPTHGVLDLGAPDE